jgi:hypothetical protein
MPDAFFLAEPSDTSFGSPAHRSFITTHTNKRCWTDEQAFVRSRVHSWSLGVAAFEAMISLIDDGEFDPRPMSPYFHPGGLNGIVNGVSGTHPSELARGALVAVADGGITPAVGRVRRVQTLMTDSVRGAWALVYVDVIPSPDLVAHMKSLAKAAGEHPRYYLRHVTSKTCQVDEVYLLAEDSSCDPVVWNRSLAEFDEVDGRFCETYDTAIIKEFAQARIVQLREKIEKETAA